MYNLASAALSNCHGATQLAIEPERAQRGLIVLPSSRRTRPVNLRVGRLYEALNLFTHTVVVIVLSASVTGHAHSASETVEEAFDLSGYYVPIRPPRAFRDLDAIELHRKYWRDSPVSPINVTVLMKNRRYRIYPHRWRLYTPGRLRFATVARGGIHFEFEGWFTVTPKDLEHGTFFEGSWDSPRAVLTGTFTKLDGDTVIASERISFYYTGGD